MMMRPASVAGYGGSIERKGKGLRARTHTKLNEHYGVMIKNEGKILNQKQSGTINPQKDLKSALQLLASEIASQNTTITNHFDSSDIRALRSVKAEGGDFSKFYKRMRERSQKDGRVMKPFDGSRLEI